MKWKETVNANWKRASSRASNWSNMLLVLGVFATAFLRTRHDEEAILHLEIFCTFEPSVRSWTRRSVSSLCTSAYQPVSSSKRSCISRMRSWAMTLLGACGLLHAAPRAAASWSGSISRFLALLDERADDLPDVVRRGEVLAPVARPVLEPHQVPGLQLLEAHADVGAGDAEPLDDVLGVQRLLGDDTAGRRSGRRCG